MTSTTRLILLCTFVWSGPLSQVPSSKPTLTPMFIVNEPGRGPAFFVECTNNTGHTQSSGSDVWPLTLSAIRLDGRNLQDEGGRIGPGLTIPVQPGDTWRGIIELWQMRQGVSRAVAFGAMVRAPLLLPIEPGRHTIAVRCAAQWSDDVPFFLEK